MKLEFFVAGTPRAKQSFRFARGGSYQTKMVKNWQEAVGWSGAIAMRAAGEETTDQGVAVNLIFYLPNRHRVDLDNLSKAVLDGLNKIVWKDDCQINVLYLCKQESSEPGVLVTVKSRDPKDHGNVPFTVYEM